MAIIIEEEGKKKSWLAILGVIILFGALISLTYYLFFSPTPIIERFIPVEIQKAVQISDVDISAKSIKEVIDMPVRKELRVQASPITLETFGRANPFLPFATNP